MKAYYIRGLEANDWITCLSWLLLEKDDLEWKASPNFFWSSSSWMVDKWVMEIKGNEREYFVSEIMRTSRTTAAETSVGSCWISSIMSTASPACRNVIEIVQLLLSPFSARQWRNEMHSLAFWPTAIRYRSESFSSSQTRGTQKVRRAMRLSGRKAWYFV